MIEKETPIFDSLVVLPGTFGLNNPQELINRAVTNFLEKQQTQIININGVPLSGKSRVKSELPYVIRRHPNIQTWEKLHKQILPIQHIEFEDAIKTTPTKFHDERYYKEETYQRVSNRLIKMLGEKLELLQENPGFLLAEYPGVTDLIVDQKHLGHYRGGQLSWLINRHRGIFSQFDYDSLNLSINSDEEVKKLAALARQIKDDHEALAQLAEKMRFTGDLNSLQGAPADIAISESRLIGDIAYRLYLKKKIAVPAGDNNLMIIVHQYLPYFFEKYLNADKNNVVIAVNQKFPDISELKAS